MSETLELEPEGAAREAIREVVRKFHQQAGLIPVAANITAMSETELPRRGTRAKFVAEALVGAKPVKFRIVVANDETGWQPTLVTVQPQGLVPLNIRFETPYPGHRNFDWCGGRGGGSGIGSYDLAELTAAG